MGSINKYYSILKGTLTGDKEEAYNELNSLSPAQKVLRSRSESRSRSSRKKPYRFGTPPRRPKY